MSLKEAATKCSGVYFAPKTHLPIQWLLHHFADNKRTGTGENTTYLVVAKCQLVAHTSPRRIVLIKSFDIEYGVVCYQLSRLALQLAVLS